MISALLNSQSSSLLNSVTLLAYKADLSKSVSELIVIRLITHSLEIEFEVAILYSLE